MLSLYKPSDWVPIITKASLEESYCTVDICEEGAHIIEGLSGDDNFTDGNEQEDCNHKEDLGVESKKKLHRWQGQTHSTTSPRRTESEQEGLGNRLGKTRGSKRSY